MSLNFPSLLQIQKSHDDNPHVETAQTQSLTFFSIQSEDQSSKLLKLDSGKEKIRSPHQSKSQNTISSQKDLISSRWRRLWKNWQRRRCRERRNRCWGMTRSQWSSWIHSCTRSAHRWHCSISITGWWYRCTGGNPVDGIVGLVGVVPTLKSVGFIAARSRKN